MSNTDGFEPEILEDPDAGQIPDSQGEDIGEQVEAPSKKLSIRESINDALQKHVRPDDKKPLSDKASAAAPGPKAGDKDSTTTPPQGTAAPTGPPAAWKSKELTPVWAGLAPAVQAAIQKREADMAKGVEQLKAQHRDLDNAVAPYRENIKRFGFTDAQAVDQLFKWQMALAGPQKVQAFVSLLQSHGVDPRNFAHAVISAQGGASPQPPLANGNGQLSPEIQQAIDGINQKLGVYDQRFAAQQQDAATQTVTVWAKDKPHYNAVRTLMGQLIQSGAATPSEGDPFALDAAYDMAIHGHSDVRGMVAQETREKEIAARKATADKARRAGSSLRSGAPVPPTNGTGKPTDYRNEKVADSIKRALADLRGQG